jgi:DNA-binding transcriptional ArsR family regulator
MMKDFREVKDIYEIEVIADGISHFIRVAILQALRKNPKMRVPDLLKNLKAQGLAVERNSIRPHLYKLMYSGIIEISRIEGKDYVILKKDVKILVKDMEEVRENEDMVRFSFSLSGGEEITRMMEVKGIDETNFLKIFRIGERYIVQIGPHSIDLPAKLMKELVENILLTYPEDEDLQSIVATLAQDKPWLFERMMR